MFFGYNGFGIIKSSNKEEIIKEKIVEKVIEDKKEESITSVEDEVVKGK